MSAVNEALRVGQDAYECRLERRIRLAIEDPSVERDLKDSEFIVNQAVKQGLVTESDIQSVKSKIELVPNGTHSGSEMLVAIGEAALCRFQDLKPPPSDISIGIFKSYAEDLAALTLEIACVSFTFDTMRELATARRPPKEGKHTEESLQKQRVKREVRALRIRLEYDLPLAAVAKEIARYKAILKLWSKRLRKLKKEVLSVN